MASEPAEVERLRLYSYATAPEAGGYIAIMRLFVGALLAEWSAHDLADRGLDLPVEVIDQRLPARPTHVLHADPRRRRASVAAKPGQVPSGSSPGGGDPPATLANGCAEGSQCVGQRNSSS